MTDDRKLHSIIGKQVEQDVKIAGKLEKLVRRESFGVRGERRNILQQKPY